MGEGADGLDGITGDGTAGCRALETNGVGLAALCGRAAPSVAIRPCVGTEPEGSASARPEETGPGEGKVCR